MTKFDISVSNEMRVWFDLQVGDSAVIHVPGREIPGKHKQIEFTVVRESKERIMIVPFIGGDVS